MNNRMTLGKKVRTALLVLAVIVTLMLTMHILVNYFDLLGFLRRIHGG